MTSKYKRVVVITVDALKAAHLPWFGYDRETAPFLSSLAERFADFRQCFSASSHTRESVPVMITGQYPDEVLGKRYRLDHPTVANSLSVPTAMFHSNPFLSRAYGFDDGFDEFDDDFWFGRNRALTLAKRLFDKIWNHHYVRAEEINKRSRRWITEQADDRFFLWNHYMDVHGPYQPPEPYRKRFARSNVSNRRAQLLLQRSIRAPESITSEERQTLVRLYDGEIRYIDEQIRDQFDWFRRQSLFDGTLFIITADHGEALGEDGFYEHPRKLTSGLTHVPLLLVASDIDPSTSSTPVGSIDLVPTILQALGSSSEEFPGINLFDSLNHDGSDRPVFSQVTRTDGDERRFVVRMREGSGRAIVDMSSKEITYNGCKEAVAALRAHLSGREWTDTYSIQAEHTSTTVTQRLRGLGYLDDE